MTTLKEPLIISSEKPSRVRKLEPYRPLSTRPWVLFLFLTATGACFALLLVVSLVEKTTDIHQRRDVVYMRDIFRVRRQVTTTIFSTSVSDYLYTDTAAASSTVVPTVSATLNAYLVPTSNSPSPSPTEAPTSATAYLYPGSTSTSSTTTSDQSTPSTSITCYIIGTVTVYGTTATVTYLSTTNDDCSTTWVTTSASGSYLHPGSITSSYQSPTSVDSLLTTTNTAYLSPTTPTSSTVPVSPTSAYLYPGSYSTSTSVSAYLSPGSYPSISSSPLGQTTEAPVSQISDDSSFLSTGYSQAITPTLIPSATSEGAYLSTGSSTLTPLTESSSAASYLSIGSSYLSTNEGSITSAPSPSFSSMLSNAYLTSDVLSTITETSQSLATMVTAVTDFSTTISQSLTTEVITLTQLSTTMSTSTASSLPSVASSNDTIDPKIGEDLVLIKMNFRIYDYFLALYLPKILAVVMSSVWSIIFAGLRLMEPFHQLSQPSGAFARDALFGAYLSSELSPSSLSAMFRGQWILILGSLVMVGWAAVIALISDAMMIISTELCPYPDGKHSYRCAPAWAVNKPILYICVALLGAVFVLTFVILWMMSLRRNNGILSDPSSIAAMAELLGNPTVMQDLREINAAASERQVKQMLGENKYKIGLYNVKSGNEVTLKSQQEPGERKWGLMKVAGDSTISHLAVNARQGYNAISNPDDNVTDSTGYRRRAFKMAYDIVMLLTAMTIFALVLGYYLDAHSDPLNNFFNNNGFGPHLVLTALALILSFGWKRTVQEVTLMAPYREMATQKTTGAPAKLSVLAPTACTMFTSFYKGLRLRNAMIIVAAVPAILSEVLLIAVAGVPFSAGQMLTTLKVSAFTSLAIVGIMMLCSVAVMVHNRRSAGGTRRLPRSPDTLIGVWLYLCGSNLVKLEDQANSKYVLTDDELKAKYDQRFYVFVNSASTDGKRRWTVDDIGQPAGWHPVRAQSMPPQSPASLQSGYTPSIYSNDTMRYDAIRRHHHERATQLPTSPISIDGVLHQSQRRPPELEQTERTQLLPHRQPSHAIPPPTPRSFVVVADDGVYPPATNSPQPSRFESLRANRYTVAQAQWGSDYQVRQEQPYSTRAQQEHLNYSYPAPEPMSRSGVVGAESPRRTGPWTRSRDPYWNSQYQRLDGMDE